MRLGAGIGYVVVAEGVEEPLAGDDVLRKSSDGRVFFGHDIKHTFQALRPSETQRRLVESSPAPAYRYHLVSACGPGTLGHKGDTNSSAATERGDIKRRASS